MKRFITYLNEYERGQKIRNTGFIRVDERSGRVNFQVSIRNYVRSHEKGKIYAYLGKDVLTGVLLGEVGVINGQGDVRLQFLSDNIMESGRCLEEMAGVGIYFPNNGYMASCWRDEAMEMIRCGQFEKTEAQQIKAAEESPTVLVSNEENLEPEREHNQDISQAQEHQQLQEMQQTQEVQQTQEARQTQEVQYPQNARQFQDAQQLPEVVSYKKMELNEIRNLPSPNWYLCNNRFLVHGFFNYGYLILKKTAEASGETAYLGVPGVFEKPEMVMAALFGFPEFQALPKEVSAAKMGETMTFEHTEKSREPKTGIFGCWLIPLQI